MILLLANNLFLTFESNFKPKVKAMAVNEKTIIKIIGYALLSPALYSLVVLLTLSFTTDYYSERIWLTGEFSSTIPIHFGLMAIAGAYLIKDKS